MAKSFFACWKVDKKQKHDTINAHKMLIEISDSLLKLLPTHYCSSLVYIEEDEAVEVERQYNEVPFARAVYAYQ